MPQHKRGPWSQTEDQYLLHLVQVHGAHNWVRISNTIQTRSPKQCRERFHQNLKPNLNHDPITPEEGLLIEQMVAEMGKRWAEIARRLRGRSDNAVKNWWNGGMNRRRRSNNNRRAELAMHHPSGNMSIQADRLPPPPLPSHHYQMSFNYPQQSNMPPQFFGQPMYHPGQMPQHLPQSQVPSNTPIYNRHSASMVDAPLPSPSAYSQLSAEGAPSLISDSSSISTHSTNDTSPVQLPPLSGPRDERRHSSAPTMLRLSGNGPYVTDGDFQVPSMPMKQPMLQEPFMAQQQQPAQQQSMQHFPHPMQYLPSQPRNPAPFQYAPMPHHQQQHFFQQQPQRNSFPPAQPLPSTPVQLPSISNLPHTSANGQQKHHGVPLDPAALAQAQLQFTPDGSPRDKMSLSNLTH